MKTSLLAINKSLATTKYDLLPGPYNFYKYESKSRTREKGTYLSDGTWYTFYITKENYTTNYFRVTTSYRKKYQTVTSELI